jgi:two-component system, OmpR family, sensor kinase
VSFRGRLVLGAAYLLTVVVLALAVPLALNIERRASSEFQSAVLARAALLAARIADLVAENPQPGTPAAQNLLRIVRENAGGADDRIVVVNRPGRVLTDSERIATPRELYETADRPEFGVALRDQEVDIRSRYSDTLGEELLLVTVPVQDRVAGAPKLVGAVRMSTPTGALAADVRERWLRLALIGLAVIVAALVLAWFLATSVARPVQRLGAAADRLGRGDLDARVPTGGPREVDALARSFNRMADALAANLEAQREFVANASHQLRTPLTGMKLRLEAIRGEGGWVGEQAARADAEIDRLSALVDDLLELARASALDQTGTTVDVADLVRQAGERWRGPANDAGQELDIQVEDAPAVLADPTDLSHVVDNLIENAIRYCPPGTRVTVEAGRRDGRVTLAVADTGPGIPAEDRERIFERFYRGSTGKRSGPGTGLGLAIVAEVVHRWGGEIRLTDAAGTRIEADFPAPPSIS